MGTASGFRLHRNYLHYLVHVRVHTKTGCDSIKMSYFKYYPSLVVYHWSSNHICSTTLHFRLQFLVGIMNIVDLVAIIPFYLELALTMFGIDVASLSDIKGSFSIFPLLHVQLFNVVYICDYHNFFWIFATITISSSGFSFRGLRSCHPIGNGALLNPDSYSR